MAGRIRAWVVLGCLAFGIGWFYTWQPAAFPRHWTSAKAEGFYNELADAFLAGQASLLRQPDPRMSALKDPYDPDKNAAFRVNDLSYFKGKYFLYMGPAPAVTVFVPFRLLTGRHLSEGAACSLLCVLGALASLALLWDVRCFQPGVQPTVFVAAALALVIADGYYAAARGTIAQQVTITNGYAFGMLALWACGRAVIGIERPRVWLAISGLCFGIAIASRPNYLFASAALMPPCFLWLRSGKRRPAEIWKTAMAAILPLGVVICMLLAYNHARFGHFLEFGQRYQLGAWNQLKIASSGLGHGWENAWRYLFAPAAYGRFFPFVTAPTWIAVSVLRHVPWLWLLPVSAYFALRKESPGPVRALGASALIVAGTNLVTLIFLPSGNPEAVLTSANSRYLLDFQPALVLFTCIGTIAAFQPAGPPSLFARRAWAALVWSLLLASAVIALSLDMGPFPSESYRRLAYVLNLPAYGLEIMRGDTYGLLALDVSLPTGATGAFEPLVSTGTSTSGALLYVNYSSPTQARFGFVSTDFRGSMSEPVTVGYGKALHLRVSMGSLYPPSGHPLWRSVSDENVAYLRRHLIVSVDGHTAFDVQAHFDAASPGQIYLGTSPFLRGYSSPTFTGSILSSARAPISAQSIPSTPAPVYGPLKVIVQFPSNPAVGSREPLVTTGVPRAGDIVYVQYLADGKISFGIDHWGGAGFRTEPIPVDVKARHAITISVGSLMAANEPDASRHHALVEIDGRVAYEGEQDTYASSPFDVAVGFNPIGGSTCDYAFTGKILSSGRGSPPR
jgi:hypothetical protein